MTRRESLKTRVAASVVAGLILAAVTGGIAWARSVDSAVTELRTSTDDVKDRLDRIEDKLDLILSEVRHGRPY